MNQDQERKPDMKVIGVPILTDNYAWIAYKANQCVVVDPGEAAPIIQVIRDKEWTLTHILLTHEHEDHIGGVSDLLEAFPEVIIFGPEEVKHLVHEVVGEGDVISILGEPFFILRLPGHTFEHIAYHGHHHLFSGDVLFAGGCGRVFTEDYIAQYSSLQRLKTLPDNTLVYAGHENTLTNLEFAQEAFADNEDIQLALKQVQRLLESGLPTLPTALGQEKKINPFLLATDVEDFYQLRQRRDNF